MRKHLPVRRADWSGVAVHKWWEVQRDHHGKLLPRKPNVWALKVINTQTPDGRVVGVLVRCSLQIFQFHGTCSRYALSCSGLTAAISLSHRAYPCAGLAVRGSRSECT